MSHPVAKSSNKQILISNVKLVKKKLIRWLAQRPAFSLFLMISLGVVLLPGVTMVVLTPVAMSLTYLGILATPGGMISLYGILFKGFLLAVLFTGLLTIGFLVMTCLGVLRSYQLLPGLATNKNK